MPIRSLADVGGQIERIVSDRLGECRTAADVYNRFEEISILVLDSEAADWGPGVLERYLATFLQLKRLELGLEPETRA